MTIFSATAAFDLQEVTEKLLAASTTHEKFCIVKEHPSVTSFLQSHPTVWVVTEMFPEKSKYLFYSLILLGQQELLLASQSIKEHLTELEKLLSNVDDFYHEIGGLIGYHILLYQKIHEKNAEGVFKLHKPFPVELSRNHAKLSRYIRAGIEHLPEMAEFYPLGGAADRLHLQEEATGKELPAARLQLGHRTLLQRLIEDLKARERLYKALTGRSVTVPIVIMTSYAKDNHRHILALLEENNWYGRPKESFHIITQPLVPTMTDNGKWPSNDKGLPLTKPSGHGVLWKLAKDHHIFDDLLKQNVTKAIVRQINNPLAGVDANLLALSGYGFVHEMHFGCIGTKRRKGAAEGAIVIKEDKLGKDQSRFALTNVEYCDFMRTDLNPMEFPSNTNILWIDIAAMKKATTAMPFPGLLVNMKEVKTKQGRMQTVARLESTMQNIAEQIYEIEKPDRFQGVRRSFCLFQPREKAISTAKKVYVNQKDYLETPEKCYYDLLYANYLALQEAGFQLPLWSSWEVYVNKGPSLFFNYNPSLGPLYSIIAQKLRSGVIQEGSLLCLEVDEVDICGIALNGALSVQEKKASQSKCLLDNVSITNKGMTWEGESLIWKKGPSLKEEVRIILDEGASFVAKDVTLTGNHLFEVPKNHTLIITEKNGQMVSRLEKGDALPWHYRLSFSDEDTIKVEKIVSRCV
jgi:UTP---glucose-1-phosphate uridylyltransferase